MKTSLLLWPLCAALIAAGCASAPKFAPAAVPSDRAIIYFYGLKDGSFFGRCQIRYDNKRLTTLRAGEYFAHQPKPGTNYYSVPPLSQGLVGGMLDKPGVEITRIRLQPGKVYYVKALGFGTLMRVDDATGSQDVVQCQLAKPGDVPAEELPPRPGPKK